jgi:hypothetical protein
VPTRIPIAQQLDDAAVSLDLAMACPRDEELRERAELDALRALSRAHDVRLEHPTTYRAVAQLTVMAVGQGGRPDRHYQASLARSVANRIRSVVGRGRRLMQVHHHPFPFPRKY